ncbi:MAG: choice-of-anchor J domain-containing protein, partial [Bacteroidales bacterium]
MDFFRWPSTSTIRNPIITYFTPGTYEVKLVVYNQYGSDSITKVNYITVNSYSPPSSPITIGTGTSQGGVYPLGINTRPQGQAKFVNDASIYLSSEIGGSCIINAIAWRPNTSRTDTRNIKIYMKHTDLTSFTACTTDDLIADATLVYDGTFTPDVVGWFTINLQNPFKYISGKNLMVITKVNSTATNLNAPSNCYYTTSPSRHQQWNGTTDPSANNGTVNNNRPNIQLTVQGYTAPTANFVGLNSVFSEDFESTTFPPTNWIIVDGDGNGNKWNHTTAQNHTLNGSRSAYHGWGDGLTYEKGWLITPAIVLPSGSPKLSFWSYNSYPTYYGDNTVLISTTTSDTSSFTPLWQPASVTEPWSQTIIDLTYYAGQTVYIAFRYRGTDAHGWYLDDVMIQQEVSDTLRTYEGDPVYFIDKSTNVPIAWDWTLQGAVDNHLYVQNPTTIYNVAGLYDVSLKAANPAGENVKNKNDFVKVIGRAPISRLEGKGNLKDYYLRPFIPIGGTVNFTDKSLRVPTGWNWTFDGGVPNTSTAQNPTNIRYSSPGLYNVTLNTYNAHGADTVTYLEYVVVGGIDTCTNFVSSDALAVYSATNGLIPGHCDFGSSDRLYRYAEYYTNSYPGKIHGFGMYVVEAQGTGKTIKVTVWDDDGGFPGSVIYTETRDITSFTAGAYNEIIFSSPVSVTGNFFIGYELNYDANHNYTTHQFCGAMATFRTSTVAPTAFASYGTTSPGTWYNFKDIFEDESSLYLDLIFEYISTGPTVIATALPDAICNSESSVLTASGADTYSWSHGLGSGSSKTVTPSTTTTYTVTGTVGGNTETATVTVTVNPLPTVTVSADPTTICEGATSVLTAGGASTYTWSHSLGSVSSITVTPSSTTTYTVTGTSAAGCTNTATVTVTVNSIPTVTASASPTSICEGESSILTAGGASTYTWSHSLGSGSSKTVIPSITTTYTVTGTNAAGCSNTAIVTVTVNSLPTVTASADPITICEGATSTLTAGGASTYSWSHSLGSGSSITVTPSSTTTYTVTGTSAAGCTNTTSVTVTVNSIPTVTASATPTSVCYGESSTLTASGASTYTWSHSLGSGSSKTVIPASTTTYTVTGTTAGCSNTATVTVTVNSIPTVTASASPTSVCAGASSTLTA